MPPDQRGQAGPAPPKPPHGCRTVLQRSLIAETPMTSDIPADTPAGSNPGTDEPPLCPGFGLGHTPSLCGFGLASPSDQRGLSADQGTASPPRTEAQRDAVPPKRGRGRPRGLSELDADALLLTLHDVRAEGRNEEDKKHVATEVAAEAIQKLPKWFRVSVKSISHRIRWLRREFGETNA